jgi:glutathione S-transferase
MTMTLYHCSGARSVRPLWTLLEMGLPHQLVALQFPPRVFNKEFKAINPLGTVPCLIDGDLNLTESAGICQYLVDRYGPTDLAVRHDEADYGTYLNWLHRSDATLTFPQTIYLRYTELEPEERRVPQAAEDYRVWFLARLRSVENALEAREYLCAGRFTIADIAIAYALFLARRLKIEEAFTPNIQRWYDSVTDRPAFHEALK